MEDTPHADAWMLTQIQQQQQQPGVKAINIFQRTFGVEQK